jgi:hypothetical protein
MAMKRIKNSRFNNLLFVFFLIVIFLAGLPLPAAEAEQPAIMTLELQIVHGKASVPKEKRDVTKVRLDVPLGEKRGQRIELALPIGYSTTSMGGAQTQFINASTPEFSVSGKPVSGGAELFVDLSYFVPAPVPDALSTTGFTPKTALRGFDVSTRAALPGKKGASVEVGSIEDQVTDRAWSATITVAAVKGEVAAGTVPKNMVFVAKVEEGDGKTSNATILRLVTSGLAAESRVSDSYSMPYASVSAAGTSVQFIQFPVQLSMRSESKEPGAPTASISIARQDRSGSGKEAWRIFETSQTAAFVSGVPVDLGLVSDGGRTLGTIVEKHEE